MKEDKNPNVGYKKPPEHTRFKKGKSGNPRGRPRTPEDLNTVLNRVLTRKVRLKDNDQTLPIREALLWKLRDLALQGDRQALALQRRIIDESGIADPNANSAEKEKQEVLRFLESLGVNVKWDQGENGKR